MPNLKELGFWHRKAVAQERNSRNEIWRDWYDGGFPRSISIAAREEMERKCIKTKIADKQRNSGCIESLGIIVPLWKSPTLNFGGKLTKKRENEWM